MCRYDNKDLLGFFMNALPFFATTIAGTVRAGYGWYLFVWLAFALFFFFVWVRAAMVRIRTDQILHLGWRRLLPLAIINLLIAIALKTAGVF